MDFSSNHNQLVDSRLIQISISNLVFLMCAVLRINCFHSFISYQDQPGECFGSVPILVVESEWFCVRAVATAYRNSETIQE